MRRAVLAFAALAVVLAACSSNQTDKPAAAPETAPASTAPKAITSAIPSVLASPVVHVDRTFVGRAAGSSEFIGIATRDGQAAVYVCDGKTGEWFGGAVDGDRINLSTPKGTRVSANIAGDAVTGSVKFGSGAAHDFTAAPPVSPGPGVFTSTGLFRSVENVGGKDAVTGWIVLPDGIRGSTSSGGTSSNGVAMNSGTAGENVRNSIPGPGQRPPANLQILVGTDSSNTLRISAARDTSTGGAAAFVSDGRDRGIWLTGSVSGDRVQASDPAGSGLALSGQLAGSQLSGTLSGGGLQQSFTLAQAQPGAGLFREVQPATDSRAVEFGWVLLASGRVTGTGNSGTARMFTVEVDESESGDSEGSVGDSSARTPSGPQPELFIRLRCAVLKLRISSIEAAERSGEGFTSANLDKKNKLNGKFDSLRCSRFF